MSKHKLLLADDSITIQKVVNLTFADEGIEVVTVGDGNAAMEKFAEITPDLVMADINMPGLNGYEICERIKKAEATRRIPVILLVGSFEPFDEEEARRVGADDFLTKPFQSIRQLVTKVNGLLESSGTDAATDDIISDLETSGTQPVPSEFEDTLRMPKAVAAEEEELGDTGMDDEMIQTNQVGGYGYDEVQNFQSRVESETEDAAKTQPLTTAELDEIVYQASEQTVSESENSAEEERGYEFVGETPSAESGSSAEEAYFLPEQAETPQTFAASESEYSYEAQTEAEVSPSAETFAPSEIEDDANLLELPPQENLSSAAAALDQSVWQEDLAPTAETPESEPESAFRQQTETETAELSQSAANIVMPETTVEEAQSESTDETPTAEAEFAEAESGETVDDETSGESQSEEIDVREVPTDGMIDPSEVEPAESEPEEVGAVSETAETMSLSPEVIEAIAAKVSERFSDRIIREIVAEVTPQITELIAKRIAEDKSRE